MSPIQYPPIYIFTYILIVTAALAASDPNAGPQTFFTNLFFWGAVYGAGLWGGWNYRREKSQNLLTASYALIGLAVAVFFKDYYMEGTVKGLLGFLLWVQAGRNFTLSNRRELYSAYGISLVLFLYGASLAMQSTFVLYIIVYTLAGMFVLLADHVDQRLSLSRGGDKVCMLGGMELPLKVWNLGVMILLVATVLYFAVPKPASPRIEAFPSGGAWYYKNSDWDKESKHEGGGSGESSGPSSRTGEDESGYGGFRDDFDIESAYGAHEERDEVVFLLKADHDLYSRGRVFDTFDGRKWTRHESDDLIMSQSDSEFFIQAYYGDQETAQIYTIRTRMPALIFAAYKPLKVHFPGSMLKKDKTLSLYAPDRLRDGTVYSVESLVETVDGRPTGGVEALFYSDRYLQLPRDLSPGIIQLAGIPAAGVEGDYERAVAIENYLKNNYKLLPGTLAGDSETHSLEKFLLEDKTGPSEYFSSSMVVLLRAEGIPARLVTGYVADKTNFNPIMSHYEVRKSDAHSWVEAYTHDYGWVSFEPTAGMAFPEIRIRRTEFWSFVDYVAAGIRRALRSHPEAWWSILIQKIMSAIFAVWRSLMAVVHFIAVAATVIWAWFIAVGWMILLTVAAVAAGSVYVLLAMVPTFRQWEVEKMRGKDPARLIFACYTDMERIFSRKGLPRGKPVTPREYEDLLTGRFGGPAPQIREMTRLFQSARYGPNAPGPQEGESAYQLYQKILAWQSKPS